MTTVIYPGYGGRLVTDGSPLPREGVPVRSTNTDAETQPGKLGLSVPSTALRPSFAGMNEKERDRLGEPPGLTDVRIKMCLEIIPVTTRVS